MTKTVKIGSSIYRVEGKKSDVQVETIDDGLCVTGLPDDDILESVLANNTLFYVIHRPDNGGNDYNSVRLHIGMQAQLREIEVLNATKLEDGALSIGYVLDKIDRKLNIPVDKGCATEEYEDGRFKLYLHKLI